MDLLYKCTTFVIGSGSLEAGRARKLAQVDELGDKVFRTVLESL